MDAAIRTMLSSCRGYYQWIGPSKFGQGHLSKDFISWFLLSLPDREFLTIQIIPVRASLLYLVLSPHFE